MRYAILAVLLVGCGSATTPDVSEDGGDHDAGDAATRADASMPDAGVPDADAGVRDAALDVVVVDAAGLDPDCNGATLRSTCTAEHLPDAYGVVPGCSAPYRLVDGGAVLRPDGLARCIDWTVLSTGMREVCCPE